MRSTADRCVTRGVLAGMIGGLVASWAMNQFQAVLSKTEAAWRKSGHRTEAPVKNPSEQDAEDATMKTADRLAYVALNRRLTKVQKRKAAPVVHYAYGTLIGGLYGALAELMPVTALGKGTVYGAAAWFLGDEIVVPKLGLSKAPQEYPVRVHAEALSAHLVYGFAADTVRRGVRAAL